MDQKSIETLSGFAIEAGEGVQKTLSGASNRSLVFTKEFHPSGMEFYRIRDYLEGWSTLGHVIDHTLSHLTWS